jgi:hypothetical protein
VARKSSKFEIGQKIEGKFTIFGKKTKTEKKLIIFWKGRKISQNFQIFERALRILKEKVNVYLKLA